MRDAFRPTKEQNAFIGDPSTEIVLRACPGSGKTDSAIQRFVERCAKDRSHGIAYLSYTNVAVDEVHKRLRQLGVEDFCAYPNALSTIDGFFRTYVFDPFVKAVRKDVPLQIQIIRDRPPAPPEISSDAAFDISGVRRPPSGKRFARPLKAWEAYIVLAPGGAPKYRYKDDADEWADVPDARRKEIFRAKVGYLERGFATFNDILYFSRLLLTRKEHRVAEITARRFQEIIVDEAQDTSVLQQSMLSILAAHGSKVSYIGDEKQGIYVFSGANPAYLDDLAATGHKPLDLTQNFRSIREIVDVVNAHFGTSMRTERSTAQGCGAYVTVGSWEVCQSRFCDALQRCGIGLAEAAVLVRKRSHLGNVLRNLTMTDWPMAQRHALAAWRHQRSGNYAQAIESAVRLLRAIVDPKWPGFEDEYTCRRLAWKCLRTCCPEPIEKETPQEWGERHKSSLETFIVAEGLQTYKHKTFGQRVSPKRLPNKGDARKQFSFSPPSIRSTVIHQVKGETISGVLVVAPNNQQDIWLANTQQEESNICYVAFTRAADLLVLQCDDDAHAAEWRKRGFVDLPL